MIKVRDLPKDYKLGYVVLFMYEAKHSVEPISISAYGHIKPKQTLEVVLVRSSDEHVTIAGTPELVTKILELMK